MQETRVQSLGWEDPLEKEMATHSSILAWKIPWTEEPGRQQSTGPQTVGHDWATSLTHSLKARKQKECISSYLRCPEMKLASGQAGAKGSNENIVAL